MGGHLESIEIWESEWDKAGQRNYAGRQNNVRMDGEEPTFDKLSLVRFLLFIFLHRTGARKT